MADIPSQIAAAQAAYDKSREVYEPLVDNEQATHTAYQNAVATGDASAISQTKAAWDSAQADLQVSVTSMNNALFKLQGLRDSYDTAQSQSNNPAQQNAIASSLYVNSADALRNQTISEYTDAFSSGMFDGNDLGLLADQTIDAEMNFQSAVDMSHDFSDQYTIDVANSADLGNLLDDFGFDNFGSADSGADGSSAGEPIVVTAQKDPPDRRVRISPMDPTSFFSGAASAQADPDTSGPANQGIMAPLQSTNGVIFPFTPTISYEHQVNYQALSPTHANTDYYIYQNTNAVRLNISGQFTAQTDEEAKYMVAAMHMFRSATKMHFGENDPNRGYGPPMMVLNGYGKYMFHKLPCVVVNFSMEMSPNVDYVTVDINGSPVSVPTLTTFTLQVIVQQTPKRHREEFSWDAFASGALLNKGGWI